MNSVNIVGRVVREPEVKKGLAGVAYCSFTVAVDDFYAKNRAKETGKNIKTADFFRIVSFGKQAENAAKYLKKGFNVAVSGRLKTDRYEKDGTIRYSTDILAEKIQFLEWPERTKENTKTKEEIPAFVGPTKGEDSSPSFGMTAEIPASAGMTKVEDSSHPFGMTEAKEAV
jgi:single-strand DNA-binding protein